MQVPFLGRAPRTKETLPDFLKWRRVTRPPLVFRGLTGSQRTPGFWGVTISLHIGLIFAQTIISHIFKNANHAKIIYITYIRSNMALSIFMKTQVALIPLLGYG